MDWFEEQYQFEELPESCLLTNGIGRMLKMRRCGATNHQSGSSTSRIPFCDDFGSNLDINSESEVSMFGHQWRIRGFAERVMIVSWVRVLDHWHLVDDDQLGDKGRQIVANRNIMILVSEKIL
ncbi:unnamed protein product [Caenorhabditis nigoni]